MCTAAVYRGAHLLFGRTLDYDISYGDEVAVTPRNLPLRFSALPPLPRHYAMLGMAHVEGTDALYNEACNEHGLCMAGLNFPHSAVYGPAEAGRDNVAQFELIPYILATCADLSEARARLQRVHILDTPYRPDLPAARLHWVLADRGGGCLVAEPTAAGLQLYDNPVGVMTNEPPFPQQLLNLSSYLHLSPRPQENRFAPALSLEPYSRGMGAIGLPGDFSSQSRFVRAAFALQNAPAETDAAASVSQFFHILGTVNLPRGCCTLEDGRHAITFYTCCCDADTGVYYYTTYENRQISAVDLRREDLEGTALRRYPLIQTEQIQYQN